MMREKRDIRPVLLKFGVISAFSLIGIFFSIFKARRRTNKPSGSSSPKAQSSSSPEHESDQVDSGRANDDILQKSFDLIATDEDESPPCSRGSVDSFTCSFPQSNKSTCDENVYLSPEFNELVKEHDLAVINGSSSSKDNAEMLIPYSGADTSNATVDHEVEIRDLRSTIITLKERVWSLELKLLEYHGFKEQESVVTELQSRLKINHMEAKLLHLKIKSLQADKKRLEEQVTEYSKVASELQAAKSKINVLEKKLTTEAEQNKGYLFSLRERVAKLQDHELKALSDSDVQLMLQKTKDLEEEVEELKKSNHSLEEENSILARKVEHLQSFATSILEDEQAEDLMKESLHLRQQNEDLTSQIERLEEAHCADIEELVYLRWINACLRYELRNYEPGAGKTVARDLSRSLSPKSEEKAKQLILEYAQKEGLREKAMSIADFDLEQWSSSHSYLTDSDEDDDSSIDHSSTNQSDITRKSKIFGKLMRLLRGKEGRHHRWSSSLETAPSIEYNKVGRSSSDAPRCNSGVTPGIGSGAGVLNLRSQTSPESLTTLSVGFEKTAYFQESRGPRGGNTNNVERQQRNSHDGSLCIYRVVGTFSGHTSDLPEDQNNQCLEDGSKAELVKYAKALKGSHQETSVRRRAASCSSFKHF